MYYIFLHGGYEGISFGTEYEAMDYIIESYYELSKVPESAQFYIDEERLLSDLLFDYEIIEESDLTEDQKAEIESY